MLLMRLAPEFSGATNVTEIEILPSTPLNPLLEKKQKTVVRSAAIPESLKINEPQVKTDLTSEQDIRVKKETRAALSGITHNSVDDRPSLGLPPQASPKTAREQAKKDSTEEGSFAEKNIQNELKEWQNLSGGGPSTFGEALNKDTPLGSITALNTDRNTFYSFYARVEDLTRYRWDIRVQKTVANLTPEAIEVLNQRRSWVTQAEFLLDPSGELKSVLLMKESGIPAFDNAAIQAFKEARIFPNPPKEMVQADGYIHLKYSFQVHWAPLRLARPQN